MIFVGERKALSALVLAFYTIQFVMSAFLGPGEMVALLTGMTIVYGAAFMGLVAGWFWARWYALGLGFSGTAMGAMMLWQIGPEVIPVFWTVTHGLMSVCLLGDGPASAFDGRKEWRERFRMDESAANRLGKSITRAGASLPYLVMAALAPKQPASLLAFAALAVGGVAVVGFMKSRGWALMAAFGAAMLSLLNCGVGESSMKIMGAPAWSVWAPTMIAGLLLLAACAPFAGSVVAALRRDRS